MSTRRWVIGLGLVALAFAAGAAWFILGARSVAGDLEAARAELFSAKDALGMREVESAGVHMQAAAGHAQLAVDGSSGPLWDVAAAVPFLGATPATVQAIAGSLDEAVDALVPAVDEMVGLQPSEIVGAGGAIDVEAVSAAVSPLLVAQTGVQSAVATLAGAPSAAEGDHVLQQVDDARWELADQLDSLDDTLDSIINGAEIVPPMLGAQGTKRYFFAILNPNEARGVGGFLGTWAIVKAKSGRLTVEEVGSNNDLPTVEPAPRAIKEEWVDRYGDGAQVANMNISPNFPDAARYWLAAWREKTGERLDGALSADVVALGQLVAATGEAVPLPDGGSLNGAQLTDFAVSGIYEKFPEGGESFARKEYQEQVARAAVEVVAGAEAPAALVSVLATAISERRVLAWVRDKGVQKRILTTPLGGSLAVKDGPNVAFVGINSSGSKLDAYLQRSARYQVGQCADSRNRVRSEFSVTLENAVPKGDDVPPYVISQASVGPDGPINATLAQMHLPNGAVIASVKLDGEEVPYARFMEQGRVSLVLEVELPPRKPRTLAVGFLEPISDRDPVAPEQPLWTAMETVIEERSC